MNSVNRRTFIKTGIAAGAAAVTGGGVFSRAISAPPPPDLAEARGKDLYDTARQAVDRLGGITRFVTRGDRVGLLINSPFRNPGTHTHPDVALAVAALCREAGARKMTTLKNPPGGYWDPAEHAVSEAETLKLLIPAGGAYSDHQLKGTQALKKADIIRELFEVDVFINISIVKHHVGTNFSCILKNMMGALPHHTCRYFHMGTGKPGWYGDLDHMNRCIADINSVRPPDLSVVDASSFILTNGPFGPGKLATENAVVAGVDPVLTDAYCCRFLNLDPESVGMIQAAAEMGLGKADPTGARILNTGS